MTDDGQTPGNLLKVVAATIKEPGFRLGSLIAVGLFISIAFLPILGIFLGTFTPVPLGVYYYRRGRFFGLTMIGACFLVVTLIHALTGQPFGGILFLEYAVLGAVIAEGFIRRWPPEKLVGYPAAAVIGLALVVLTMISLSAGKGPWTYGRQMVETQVRVSLKIYEDVLFGHQEGTRSTSETDASSDDTAGNRANDPEAAYRIPETGDHLGATYPVGPKLSPEMDRLARILVNIFPGAVIMGMIMVVWANFMVTRILLTRLGPRPPGMSDLTEWKAPEILVWVLIACGFAVFPLTGTLQILALNAVMILGMIYFFQGLSILSFWLHRKGAPPLLRVAIFSLIAVQQYLALVLAAAGLFDIWFDFRKLNRAENKTDS